MTTPTTTQRQDSSLTRDVFHAARYYLWRPRVLLTLAAIAIVAGLALNWSWLVAAGLAPILISTLPCLIMCAFGVCMMCRSGEKHSAPVRDVAQAPPPPATLALATIDNPSPDANASISLPDAVEAIAPAPLGAPTMDDPSVGVTSCCQGPMSKAKPPPMIDLQPSEERKKEGTK
jgi:hypothetical protein